MQFFYLTLSATMVVILKNTLCSLNMTTSVQTRIMQILLVSWDGVLTNNQMLNWLKLLAQKVYELGIAVGIDMNWKGQGVKKLLQDTAYTLAEHAHEDQCTTANPKEPLISELKEIIEIAFDYKG